MRTLSKPIAQPRPVSRISARRAKRTTEIAQENDFKNAVWARDGWKCRHCGRAVKRGAVDMLQRGEVHHIEPRSRAKGKRYDVRNGVVLCVECHGKAQRHEITIGRVK